jgi:hypothetical protein
MYTLSSDQHIVKIMQTSIFHNKVYQVALQNRVNNIILHSKDNVHTYCSNTFLQKFIFLRSRLAFNPFEQSLDLLVSVVMLYLATVEY